MTRLEKIGEAALGASRELARFDADYKNKLLNAISRALTDNADKIIAANSVDLENAKKAGMSASLLDRLAFTEARIRSTAEGVAAVASLPDPIGEVMESFARPNGLKIEKRRVPLGVIGIIYEARPNVTVDTAALCLKSSNAVILRGGKEAVNTNRVLAELMRSALKAEGANEDAINLVTDTSRESANEMMRLNRYIDVLIPRGGAGLINAVVNGSTVPVIQTGVGNCHIYVDKSADVKKAVDIIINAKVSRPSVCNAAESLLVHKDVNPEFFPLLNKKFAENGVRVLGCPETAKKMNCFGVADDAAYAREFSDKIISMKIVENTDEAIEHIARYSTKHSDCIITEDKENAKKFTNLVDSAAVYVNASTRFTDGFEFGFGAEIGISTQKLHARGPMGLKELTSYKYVVTGNGQTRN